MNGTANHFEFSSRRVPCPSCGSKRSFSPVTGCPESGKCHACGTFIPPNRNASNAREGILTTPGGKVLNLTDARRKPRNDDGEVPPEDILQSLVPLVRAQKREPCPDRPSMPECAAFDELAVKFEYESGLSRMEAETQAAKALGYFSDYPNTPMLKKIPEELTLLRHESAFAATITELTRPTILSEWYVGLSSDGGTLFWYINREGRFRNCKKIWYAPNGWNRLRDTQHPPHFLYKGNPVPLYGEWQLVSCRGTVVLVESEKSAMILSCYLPGYSVLATGGSESLTERRASVLQGRTVNILFDRDEAGTRGAERAHAILSKVGSHAKIINPYELWPDAPDGYDGADALYNEIILGIKHG
ncbi:MAG TPA: DUF6371 domain-containing protein [Candidatus Kapabacteria bacterium]|jgi:hypothetical protein